MSEFLAIFYLKKIIQQKHNVNETVEVLSTKNKQCVYQDLNVRWRLWDREVWSKSLHVDNNKSFGVVNKHNSLIFWNILRNRLLFPQYLNKWLQQSLKAMAVMLE